jgi:colanic acid/amylovoran biosynthesis glycosyltransferase
VTFTGFLNQPDLVELYRRGHIFLHPSEMPPDQNQEGVPNSMLEAMATGLPVVATYHGGIPEAIDDGQSGLLRDEGDAGALSEALIELVEDPDLWHRLSKTAARHVEQRFEQNNQIKHLENCYREVLKNS